MRIPGEDTLQKYFNFLNIITLALLNHYKYWWITQDEGIIYVGHHNWWWRSADGSKNVHVGTLFCFPKRLHSIVSLTHFILLLLSATQKNSQQFISFLPDVAYG